jgi:hypothetical protein
MGQLGTGVAQRFNGLDGWKRTCMRRMYMYSCAVENAGEHVRSPTAAVSGEHHRGSSGRLGEAPDFSASDLVCQKSKNTWACCDSAFDRGQIRA